MFANLIRLFSPSTMASLNSNHDGLWRKIYVVRRLFALAMVSAYAAIILSAGVFVAPGLGVMLGLILGLYLLMLFVWLDQYWLGGIKQPDNIWEDPALTLIRKVYGPSDDEWMAALELGLDKEFPHWRAMVAQSPNDADRFLRGKTKLELEWLQLKPNYSNDLAKDAMWAIIGAKQHYGGALSMHLCYRDWEIAQMLKKRLPDVA